MLSVTKLNRGALMIGNHKMNLTPSSSANLVSKILNASLSKGLFWQFKVRFGVAPSPACLQRVSETKENFAQNVNSLATNFLVGGQSFYAERGKIKGAFTGETSLEQLIDLSANFSILGHSETRDIPGYGVKGLNLTDEMINERLLAALKYLNESESEVLKNFFIILCVGETLQDNEKGKTFEVLKRQIEVDLNDVSHSDIEKGRVVIAYEPVWAIGTGKTATPNQANDACAYIRSLIEAMYSAEVARKILIQYGGSMNEKNVEELMSMSDIDGGLIGGASLKADEFVNILAKAIDIYN